MEPHEPAATRGTDAGLAAPLAAEARGVVRRFPVAGDVVTALDHVDLDVPVGRMTVVIGPSGSGKSTLLALLSCVQRPDEGTVMIGQTDVLALTRGGRRELRRDRLGIVLPQPSENLLDHLDAAANLRWAARQRRGTEHADNLDELLDSVGLAGTGGRRVRELSGGEQQRLAVACALAGRPELVILDEPTASLDRTSGSALVEALAAVAARGSTMVIATHDRLVAEAADMTAELDHGLRVR
ncbi:MAG: ABC transporter ATP-binding protein [Ilumatobacteraceae bacterium]